MFGPAPADARFVEDGRDGFIVPGHQQVDPGHAVDPAQLLDGLRGQPGALGRGLAGRDLTAPTPARMEQRSCRPRSRTRAIHRPNAATSKTNWVCTNCAPAATFRPSRW